MGNKKWKIKIWLLASCFLLLSLLTSHFSLLNASDPKKKLQEIQKKLSREKRKVKQTIKKEKSILSELEKINKLLRKKREELRYYDKRLSDTRNKIRLLEKEILLLNKKLQTRKKFLKGRLKSLYKYQHGDIASILISARDYQELIKRIKYISYIADYDSRQIKTFSSEIEERNIKMSRMEDLRKGLKADKTNIKNKANEMRAERKNKDQLLASIKSERSSYEKMIKELEESSKNLYEMIKKLESEKLPLSVTGKGFSSLKGRLPWPVNGKVLVHFGKQNNTQFNIPTFRKGIEIEAKAGYTALSVLGGKVVYADWFKGYGLLLIINHGEGFHSLYAHLAEIFHKTGDIIKVRQAVGKIGESGLLDVPSLYFEIRHKGKPRDPLKWLRYRKK
ncbi:MAG: peptidoglycan DD-metalloendopeptidase family protein [Thermodesulfovibrionia bacterium]